jgi:hypothetical protein
MAMIQRYGLILLCSAAWLVPARAEVSAENKAAVAYVQGLQTDTGGFLDARPKPNERLRPTLRATSAAVRALHYLGADLPRKDAVVRFVESCFDKDKGGFANFPGGEPEVFTTAVGLMAVVELKMSAQIFAGPTKVFLKDNVRSFEDLRIAVAGLASLKEGYTSSQWSKIVDDQKNRDGTYGKGNGVARATASAVVTWLRMTSNFKPGDEVLQVLKAGQRKDGGFGKEGTDTSDLETSYRVMRCFYMLKAEPDVPKLRAFVARCRNEDGGYGIAPGQPSSVGSTYFAAVITHWLEKK